MAMHSLFNRTDAGNILERLDHLTPDSQRLWGKMTVSQMLAHCSAAMETATGRKHYPRLFIGRILGSLVKKNFLSEKPFPKGSPTDKHFIIKGEPDFAAEKQRLYDLVCTFADGGSEKCTPYPHAFFGKMAPEEWSISMYKHLDHHFRQFGV
jgi:hypothetical protein